MCWCVREGAGPYKATDRYQPLVQRVEIMQMRSSQRDTSSLASENQTEAAAIINTTAFTVKPFQNIDTVSKSNVFQDLTLRDTFNHICY